MCVCLFFLTRNIRTWILEFFKASIIAILKTIMREILPYFVFNDNKYLIPRAWFYQYFDCDNFNKKLDS